jgi:hypothetical protein
MPPFILEDFLTEMREQLEQKVKDTKWVIDYPMAEGIDSEHENAQEITANLILSMRHLEDARMRLGKVFQAMDGGKSCYNK